MKKLRILIAALIVTGMGFFIFLRSKPHGYVELHTQGFKSYMNLHGGLWDNVFVRSSHSPLRVRTGVYTPSNAVVTAKGDGGQWWTIRCSSGPRGNLERIKVEEDKPTIIKLGPPFKVETDTERKGPDVSIGISIVDHFGIRWSPRITTSKGTRPPPKFIIVNESGKVLASGKFEYG